MSRRGWRFLFRSGSVAFTLAAVAAGVWLMPVLEDHVAGLPDYGDVQRFDPLREGGHLLPHLDQWMQGGRKDHRVRIVTNSKGFRNRKEFGYAVPAGTYRILLLGDSFVDGMRTDQDDTIGAVLEALLRSRAAETRFTDFEVLVSGHGDPAEAWYAFQEHGRKYAPHLVVLGITLGNDLTWQSYGRSVRPAPGEDGSARLAFDPSRREFAAANEPILLPPEAFDPASAWDFVTRAEMRARRFLADRFGLAGYAIPQPTRPFWSVPGRVHAADFTLSLGQFLRPLPPEEEGWYRDLEAVLAGFGRGVRASGAELQVLVFPVRIQVDPEEWELTRRAYGLRADAFDLDTPDRRIAACCRREGLLPVLDLVEAFRTRVAAGEGPLYRPRGDMHFNEAGQRLAAHALGERIRASILP